MCYYRNLHKRYYLAHIQYQLQLREMFSRKDEYNIKKMAYQRQTHQNKLIYSSNNSSDSSNNSSSNTIAL